MNPTLNRNVFFVKEHVGIFKASNNFDIYDPASKQVILECREENLGFFTKMLRFTDYKRMTPFELEIRTPQGETLLTVKRGVAFYRSTVEVLDDNGKVIGRFRQRLLSIGGKFDVLDANDQLLCKLQGKLLGWDFRFL